MVIVIIFLLAWFVFCIIMFIRPASISRRQPLLPLGRAQDRSAPDRGDLGGVREPRHPKSPRWPAQAAAVVPEENEREEPVRSIGYSDSPQQTLRLEEI